MLKTTWFRNLDRVVYIWCHVQFAGHWKHHFFWLMNGRYSELSIFFHPLGHVRNSRYEQYIWHGVDSGRRSDYLVLKYILAFFVWHFLEQRNILDHFTCVTRWLCTAMMSSCPTHQACYTRSRKALDHYAVFWTGRFLAQMIASSSHPSCNVQSWPDSCDLFAMNIHL